MLCGLCQGVFDDCGGGGRCRLIVDAHVLVVPLFQHEAGRHRLGKNDLLGLVHAGRSPGRVDLRGGLSVHAAGSWSWSGDQRSRQRSVRERAGSQGSWSIGAWSQRAWSWTQRTWSERFEWSWSQRSKWSWAEWAWSWSKRSWSQRSWVLSTHSSYHEQGYRHLEYVTNSR